MSIIQRLIEYLKSSRRELKYVNWPSRKITLKFTALVIGVSSVITLFLGGLDLLFNYIISKFIL